MKTIGIIGAMDEEIAFIRNVSDIVASKKMLGLDFYIGRIHGKSIVVVRSGIGKVNAAICAQALIDLFAVDYIINVGVAGAIASELKIGDIVISTDTVQHDMDASSLGDPKGIIPRMNESYFPADEALIHLAKGSCALLKPGHNAYLGRIASGDQFINSKSDKDRLWRTFKAFCVEMEGAAIAQTCYLNKIPYVIVRSISDKADESANINFEDFKQIAVENSSVILNEFLKNI